MPRYLPEPPHTHGSACAPGVLLVNLGTPQAATAAAVRAYLREFLSDPRVVELPRGLWLPLLHGVILRTRPRASAKRYAAIWSAEGSPLLVHTARQATMLRGYLGQRTRERIEVDFAMRYGQPSIAQAIAGLKARGCDRIVVLPLYPQYSASATASVFDAVGQAARRMRNVPGMRLVKHFHDDPGYINALARNISEYWMNTGRPDQLVMSFHGVPRFTLDAGDPYHCECQATARLLATALGLPPQRYRVSFQSRFGRAQWLQPYTAQVLAELGRARTARVDVVCPGFVSDCLETLEEIALEGKTTFLQAGGQAFHYIPCLNERDDWLHALTEIAWTNLHGWMPSADAQALAAARARALELGAPR
ncbi:MAG: ferrochelatase [Burkholderiales bacterium]|nr:ferrochelatase [Burkholderiales bacterium]